MPALSLVSGGNGTSRRLADPAPPLGDAADPSASPGALNVAGLLASNLVVAAVATSGTPEGPPAPSAAASAAVPAASPAAGGAPNPALVSPSAATATPATPATPATSAPATAPARMAPPPVAPATPHVATVHPASSSRSSQGVASWLNIAAGTCANNDAPMGATITVTNSLGLSVTCKVVSRGPFVAGRIVDLSASTFALLGSLSRGLVSVTVTW